MADKNSTTELYPVLTLKVLFSPGSAKESQIQSHDGIRLTATAHIEH